VYQLMHYHLRQLFDAESTGRDNPGPPPRGLCAVGWNRGPRRAVCARWGGTERPVVIQEGHY